MDNLKTPLVISPFLTKKECCAFLRIGMTNLTGLISDGRLKYEKIGGKILVSKLDAVAFIEYQKSYRHLTRPQKQHIQEVVNTTETA